VRYHAYIDGLRAIAVLSVVIFHGFPNILSGGFVGVDIFFVISGFLITYLIAAEIRDEKFSFIYFYTRRIRRLLPAGLIVYTTAIIAGAIVLAPPEFKQFGESLLATALIFSNHFFASLTGYFDTPANELPLLHTWSLAIEEQFYLIWPALMMLVLMRINTAWRLGIATTLLLASLLYAEISLSAGKPGIFFSFLARAWELLLGATLALLIDNYKLRKDLAEPTSIVGILLIILSIFLLNEQTRFPGISALPASLGTAMIIAAGFHNSPIVSKILSNNILVYFGLISYSLYLWHWPILSFARIYLERPLLPVDATILIGLAFILSALTYRFIEKPFRSAGGSMIFSPRLTITGAVIAIAVTALIGVNLKIGSGWTWRLDPVSKQVYNQKYAQNPYRLRCYGTSKVFKDNEFCNFGAPKPASASFDFAIFGDSNADHFVPTFVAEAKRRGISGRQVTQSTCLGLVGMSKHQSQARQDACQAYQKQVLVFVEKNPNLKLAILSGNWIDFEGTLGQNELARLIPSANANSATPPDRTSLEDHILAMIGYFRNAGIKVHLIGPIPQQNPEVKCVIKSFRAGGDAQQCGIDAKSIHKRFDKLNNMFSRIAGRFEDVTVTLPLDIMCNQKRCPLVRNGVFLYRDVNHINAVGAASLSDQFHLPEIK